MTGPRSKLPMQRSSPLAAATSGALPAHVERPRPSNDNPGWSDDPSFWAGMTVRGHEQGTSTMSENFTTAQTAIAHLGDGEFLWACMTQTGMVYELRRLNPDGSVEHLGCVEVPA